MLLAMKTRNVIGLFRSVSIVTVKLSFFVSQIVSCLRVDHTQSSYEMTAGFKPFTDVSQSETTGLKHFKTTKKGSGKSKNTPLKSIAV